MAFENPSVADFKAYFFRDFVYGATLDTVTDQDIENAYAETAVNFNECLWSDQANYTLGYLLLSAHFLVINLRSASQGLSGQFNWNESSKSVGSVSEAFSIPQRILDNPEYAMLSKTNYGARYLFLILPQLSGQMYVVCGRTLP